MSVHKLLVEFDEEKVDAIFAGLNQVRLPGAAVGIAIHGKPVYRKGFGLASMELPVVLSPSIRMRIYSTTKHFTCLAYLLLCEEAKADIDDPIGKYLPELHPVAREVTMRQLMGNISGLRNAHDINWQFSGTGRPLSSADLLSFYRDINDANAAPGTTWIYNNGGFLMLSFAIERITGQALEEVLRERIFDPLGMYDTMLRRFDTDFVANSATMHMTSSAGGFDRSYIGTAAAGEGGMVSTVDDMLRWLAHMDAPRVGSAASWALMRTPQILVNGTSTGYGLGLFVGSYRGVEVLYHAGGGPGANAQMLKVPAAGLNVAIMVNRQDVIGEELVNNVLDACLPGLDSVKRANRQPPAHGVFRSPTTGRVIQLRTSSAKPPWIEEGQQIASIDGIDIPVEPDGAGALWPARVAGWMKVEMMLAGDRESPDSIRVTEFGNVDELLREKPAEKADVKSIAGHYRSDPTGTDVTIDEAEHGAKLSTVGRFGSAEFRLEYLAQSIWKANPAGQLPWVGGVLLFDRDGAGFRFSNITTRLLPFRRCA